MHAVPIVPGRAIHNVYALVFPFMLRSTDCDHITPYNVCFLLVTLIGVSMHVCIKGTHEKCKNMYMHAMMRTNKHACMYAYIHTSAHACKHAHRKILHIACCQADKYRISFQKPTAATPTAGASAAAPAHTGAGAASAIITQ